MAVGEANLPELTPVKGLKLGVVEAGVRYPDRKDLVLIELEAGASCSLVTTQNAFCAAPVHVCRKHIKHGAIRYLLINTGNANAGTGQQGYEDALQCCREVADLASVEIESVLPFSTGVIGEALPVNRIVAGLPAARQALTEDAWLQAAQGIMTTDTRPKAWSETLMIDGEAVVITGISKGAGMIRPNMATMLGFIATDASVPQSLLDELIVELSECSFNRATVDGDTSTNDCCVLMATGQSKAAEITRQSTEFEAFYQALKRVFVNLAQAIVRDGEGATKFISILVEKAASSSEALDVAYTVAHSPLVKTALFASDPNWGRILAAVGRSPVAGFDLGCVDIYLGAVCLIREGEPDSNYTEAQGQAVVEQDEIEIRIVLNRGEQSETVWTTDLSHDYVTINAEYRT